MQQRLPHLSFLAVAAVIEIAIHGRGQRITAKNLGRLLGLSDRALEGRLQALVRCGVLNGARGPEGGYQLARASEAITVFDIIQAMADLDAADWLERPSELIGQVIQPAIQQAEEEFAVALSEVTIAELACAAKRLRRQ